MLLTSAVALLSASVGMDVLLTDTDWLIFLEDTAKFVGLCGWVVYWLRASLHGLAARPQPAPSLNEAMPNAGAARADERS